MVFCYSWLILESQFVKMEFFRISVKKYESHDLNNFGQVEQALDLQRKNNKELILKVSIL